jgi:hypothetical protein
MRFALDLTDSQARHLIRLISIACYILIAFYLMMAIYLVSGFWTKPGWFYRTGNPAGADFLQIWGASSLARAGHPAQVYDPHALKLAETAIIGGTFQGILPWHYPPSFLLLMLPISLVPYFGALLLWLVIPLGGLLIILHKIVPHPLSIKLALAFPATALNMFYGQGAFLVAFLMGSGVLLLDSYPILSGILFSLILNYKPHLGLLILVALIFSRYWKTLGSVMITSVVLMIASAWILGLTTWIAFWKNISQASLQLTADATLWDRMPTVFAAIRLQGGGVWTATIFQFIILLGVIALVSLVWSRDYPLAVRGSVLLVGTLLCTPHAFDYDLTLLLLPLAWFAGANWQKNRLTVATFVFFLMWLSPMINRAMVSWARLQIEPLMLALFLIYLVKQCARGQPRLGS